MRRAILTDLLEAIRTAEQHLKGLFDLKLSSSSAFTQLSRNAQEAAKASRTSWARSRAALLQAGDRCFQGQRLSRQPSSSKAAELGRRASPIALAVPRAVPCLSLPGSHLPRIQFLLIRLLALAPSFPPSLPPAVSGRQVKVTVWHVCFCIIYVVEDRVRHLEDSLRSHVNPSKQDSIAHPAK